MKKLSILSGIFFVLNSIAFTQDTFSIVAVDTITGEVGSAGASCVDLFQTPFPNDDFLSELFPGIGAINCQAAYLQSNQTTTRNRMNAGDSPQEIIDYVVANDVQSNPTVRQYGVVKLNNGNSISAAFTGSNCISVAGQRVGQNYVIIGNILLNEDVLDDMEYQFLNTEGDLQCKLMAALQGAKRVGADSRCAPDGTSSLFAFIKVSQLEDIFGSPSFLLSVRTQDNSGIEPIDSLQTLFDMEVNDCAFLGMNEQVIDLAYNVHPNPTSNKMEITSSSATESIFYRIIGLTGEVIQEGSFVSSVVLSTQSWKKGVYIVEVEGKFQRKRMKVSVL